MEVKQANNIRLQLLRESVDDFKHTLNLSGNSSFEEFFEYKSVGGQRSSNVKRSPLMSPNGIHSPNTQVQKFIEKVMSKESDKNVLSILKEEVFDSSTVVTQKNLASTFANTGESASKRQKLTEKMLENRICDGNFNEIENEFPVQFRRERKDTCESDYYDAVEELVNEPSITQRFSINLSEKAGRRSIPLYRRSVSDSYDISSNDWVVVPESAVKILLEVSV